MRNQLKFNLLLAAAVFVAGCSKAPQTADAIKKMPAGQEHSGFLKDYSALKAHPKLPEAMTYVNPDKMKSLHRYVAVIVDPVEIYVATDADESKIPTVGPKAAARYFHRALVNAVDDAFPVVTEPGPLVLRLRSAIVGVDAGGAVAKGDVPETANALPNAVNIGKVTVELELVDSETGERIAAAVDKAKLGEGAEVGAEHFSRVAKFHAAKEAFDGWAARVREFLDAEHELSAEDADKADKAYKSYGQ